MKLFVVNDQVLSPEEHVFVSLTVWVNSTTADWRRGAALPLAEGQRPPPTANAPNIINEMRTKRFTWLASLL